MAIRGRSWLGTRVLSDELYAHTHLLVDRHLSAHQVSRTRLFSDTTTVLDFLDYPPEIALQDLWFRPRDPIRRGLPCSSAGAAVGRG
jgi:hypothetical protein